MYGIYVCNVLICCQTNFPTGTIIFNIALHSVHMQCTAKRRNSRLPRFVFTIIIIKTMPIVPFSDKLQRKSVVVNNNTTSTGGFARRLSVSLFCQRRVPSLGDITLARYNKLSSSRTLGNPAAF